MLRRGVLIGLGCLGVAWCAVAAAGGGGQGAGEFVPAAPVESLMYAQDQHFANLQGLLRGNDKDRNEKIMHEANVLAELANVNQYQKKAKENEDYRKWAGELRSLSLELAAKGGKGDVAAGKDLLKKLHATCNACHDKYQDKK